MVSTHTGDGGHTAGHSSAAAPSTQATDLWNEVGYYTIQVPLIAPAKVFWGGLFGWRFAPDNDAPDGGQGAHVESSVVPFGLHASPGAEPAASPVGVVHPYFRVADLDAAVARVRELGGVVESINRYESGGNATCRDDQGVPFELWQPAPNY